jgi:osmotically-inducible protein OsmY
MKGFIGGVVCAALLAWGPVTASAQTATATTTVKRTNIDSRIEQRLKADSTLKRYNIKVSVDGDVATLSGTVPTEADRAKAADLAKVNGITRVDNQIIVDLDAATRGTTGAIEKGADKTKSGIDKAIDKSKEGTVKAYEKSKDAGRTAGDATVKGTDKAVEGTEKGLNKTGEAISDTWITTKIKADMVNEDTLSKSDISVHTDNGVVTLTGTVMTEAGHARAVAIAKATKGVDRVIDKLTIGPAKQ